MSDPVICLIKEVRIHRADDGRFWVSAVEGKSGQDLCFFSTIVRDAYVGVLVALWLWHYGQTVEYELGWHGRAPVWGSRLMRWVAVISRVALAARLSAWSRRSRPAAP